MTKKTALLSAIATIKTTTSPDPNVLATLQSMVDALSVKREMSDEARAKINEHRKAKAHALRNDLMRKVLPVLDAQLHAVIAPGLTAKELFDKTQTALPADWTWHKVQGVLTHELQPFVTVTETKGEAKRYYIV